jgi:predicted nucleotidyltransferase
MVPSFSIGRSKVRQDILVVFFSHPAREHYLRELERLLGYSAGNIRRELLKFKAENLFKTRQAGNLIYYSVNENHALYHELISIVFKTIGVAGSLRDVLGKFKEISTAFIYGSFASKSENSGSDIDVMIIGDINISTLNQSICTLERKLGRDVNTTIYSRKEYLAKKRESGGFLRDVLDKPKIMLIGHDEDLR